jgi:hypothetical protein
MNSLLLRFVVVCLLFATALFFATERLHDHFFKVEPGPFVYFLFFWFPAITIFNYVLLVRAMKERPRSFITAYYITVMIRMLASVFILVFYILTTKYQPFATISVFAAMYFVFFILEIIYLSRLIRFQNSQTTNPSNKPVG